MPIGPNEHIRPNEEPKDLKSVYRYKFLNVQKYICVDSRSLIILTYWLFTLTRKLSFEQVQHEVGRLITYASKPVIMLM